MMINKSISLLAILAILIISGQTAPTAKSKIDSGKLYIQVKQTPSSSP